LVESIFFIPTMVNIFKLIIVFLIAQFFFIIDEMIRMQLIYP